MYTRPRRRGQLGEARRLTTSAEQGNADGLARLALMSHHGKGGDVTWRRRAASTPGGRKGSVLAACNLGYMTQNGEGGCLDIQEAKRLYTLAADKGNPIGQLNLANMYLNGEGGPADVDEARRLYTLSAERGDPGAMFQLAGLYERGRGGRPDDRVARMWTRGLGAWPREGGQEQMPSPWAAGSCSKTRISAPFDASRAFRETEVRRGSSPRRIASPRCRETSLPEATSAHTISEELPAPVELHKLDLQCKPSEPSECEEGAPRSTIPHWHRKESRATTGPASVARRRASFVCRPTSLTSRPRPPDVGEACSTKLTSVPSRPPSSCG